MDRTQPIRNPFGGEESEHALIEDLTSSRPALDACLTKAMDEMLLQAFAERDVPVSRSGVGIAVRRHTDFSDDMQVSDDEQAHIRVHQQTKRRFALGRAAARAALQIIGLEPAPFIGRGARGEPLWPEGFSGSITHSFPWSIAVAARCGGPVALGIDLENITRLQELSIMDLICSAGESDWVSAGDPRTRLVMMFSAKEALYKAFYPFLRRYIDFQDVEMCWSEPRNLFECHFVKQPTLGLSAESFNVYCRRSGEFIISLMMCGFAGVIDRIT